MCPDMMPQEIHIIKAVLLPKMFDPNLIMRKQSDNCRIWDILPVSFKDVNVMRQKKDEMTFRLGD